MANMDGVFSAFAGLVAFACGLISTMTLLAVGHGWSSLIPVVAFPVAAVLAVKVLVDRDA